MTCKEFYDLNVLDETNEAVVLEGVHPITDTRIYLSIVFSETDGWGIRTEEDTVLDQGLAQRNLLPEALNWLTVNFEDFERTEGVDCSEFFDEIASQLITTGYCVDITHSSLTAALQEIQKQKNLEAMNYRADETFPPQPPIPEFGIARSTTRRVLIISGKNVWHDELGPIFKNELFLPISAWSIEQGVTQYNTLSNCAIILDATDLSVNELDALKALKKKHPSMYLVTVIGQHCEYADTIISISRDVFKVRASQKSIVKSLHGFFQRAF